MSRRADKTAPSFPGLSDEWEPTDPRLWQRILAVARGDAESLRESGRSLQAPNGGRGFYPWPHPNGSAWAVKQYNGFGGKWQRKASQGAVVTQDERQILIPAHQLGRYHVYLKTMSELERLYAGPTVTVEGEGRHTELCQMRSAGWARLASKGPKGHFYWEITSTGVQARAEHHRLLSHRDGS